MHDQTILTELNYMTHVNVYKASDNNWYSIQDGYKVDIKEMPRAQSIHHTQIQRDNA